jgi:predicted N-acetyltransferase YhbS
MDLKLRRGTPEDAEICGGIAYRAFRAIADAHNFPHDFPSPEAATAVLGRALSHPAFYSVVAEISGEVAGSNFLDERSPITGIGPITVDPVFQNQRVGRALMEDVMVRSSAGHHPGTRLVQVAYHNRSLSLYAKLGFEAREPLSTMQGAAIGGRIAERDVRAATKADLEACNRMCAKIHGYDRGGQLADALSGGTATVVTHDGRISGYATGIGFSHHAIGESNDDLKALIMAAPSFMGPGILVPTRNAELFRWCLENGLRIVQPMTLMSIGRYNEPAGRYLPSILF